MASPRSTSSSVREQKLARVIDREVAPIWHDRFARLLLRELPDIGGAVALDIHSGSGRTTAELLQRLDEDSRIVALSRDQWLMQVAKTKVKPKWKKRVYFKHGDIDDVTEMGDDTYDLATANLVLGEQVVDWKMALGELIRVTKPGGRVIATMPMHGTWQEVEDLFEELLRDEGHRREVGTLNKLRRRRPRPTQLVTGLRELGLSEEDFVVEHERFELLFRSGREFLFAPVIEHGPLRLWKAILGRVEKPQALFWRFKEVIDTYYAGHVLAVTVVAGLVRLRVPGAGVTGSYSADYWARYPSLVRVWADDEVDVDFDDDFDIDMDVEIEVDVAVESSPAASDASLERRADTNFSELEGSGLVDLPSVEDAIDEDDAFAGLLDELKAEDAVAAELAAEDAKVEAAVATPPPQPTGRAATLGALGGSSPLPGKLPRRPGESGASPLPGKLPRRSGGSGASPLPGKLPRREGSGPLPPLPKRDSTGPKRKVSLTDKLKSISAARKSGESGATPLPPPPTTESGAHKRPASVVPPPPATGSQPSVKPKPVGPTGPKPTVTKPGEPDPFAGMLQDDDEAIEDLDEFLDAALVETEPAEDDEDLADSFGEVSPKLGRSSRPVPPPPKKKS